MNPVKYKKKVIYTLNINYSKDITNITYPLLKRYAKKIDADFEVITSRKFPDWPVVYEKLQIYNLAREQNREWIYYIDSDAIVHPEFFDVTDFISKDTVLHHGADFCPIRWKMDDYFRRDKRGIGSCNWFTVASDWCLDLWKPLDDLTLEEALKNIYPTVKERKTVIIKDHLIDDYVLSRNIAKYGLHFTTVIEILKRVDPTGNFFWHEYLIPLDEKIKAMREVLRSWNLCD